jgi:hypothetical protein
VTRRLSAEQGLRPRRLGLALPDLEEVTARRCCHIVATSGARASVEALTTLAALSTDRDR